MMQRSAHILPFVLAGVSLLAAQGAHAQQQQQRVDKDTSDDLARILCQTPVKVTGAVFNPGRFMLQRRVNLLEVLTAAGGLTERAGKTVEIRRAGLKVDCDRLAPQALHEKSPTVEVYNLSELLRDDAKASAEVQPGDQVIVSEVGVAYVYGHVVQPREILLKERTSVTQAIKIAGGVFPGGITNRVRIMRGCDPMKIIVVDLKAVEKGRAADVLIEPYDIVFVPGTRFFMGAPLCHRLVPQLTALPSRVIY
jgi:polysaccharide export outer membrane protein